MLRSVKMAAASVDAESLRVTKEATLSAERRGEDTASTSATSTSTASTTATPTYGPFGESEDVANPDKLGPTMFTDVSLMIDGEPAAVGDCVAAYHGDTGRSGIGPYRAACDAFQNSLYTSPPLSGRT